MTSISNRDKAECAKREAKLRRRVYPRYTGNGAMTINAANREIELMEAIAADYAALAEAEEKTERLL